MVRISHFVIWGLGMPIATNGPAADPSTACNGKENKPVVEASLVTYHSQVPDVLMLGRCRAREPCWVKECQGCPGPHPRLDREIGTSLGTLRKGV